MFCLKFAIFSVPKALIYYAFNRSQLNSCILLVFPHVANFIYVANFTFLTLKCLVMLFVFNRAPRFKGFQQQDSHELLRYLLDGMKAEEIKASPQTRETL